MLPLARYAAIIHQIFSLARDWSKHLTWANIPPRRRIRGRIFPLEAHSFLRASLSENCPLLGTDNVRGQISEHIFAPNEGYCLFIFYKTHKTLILSTKMSRTSNLIYKHKLGPVQLGTLRSDRLIPYQFKKTCRQAPFPIIVCRCCFESTKEF